MENGHIGQVLGNYQLLQLLGQGGFASVYLAEHRHLKTQAAVKLLHDHLNQQYLQSFEREAQMLASLQHKHILHVSDFGLEESFPYFVMDYAPGGSLREHHPIGTRVPLPTVVSYVNQVSSALHYIHKANLIHCDVKPENMLLDSAGNILLSDFGIVAIAHGTASLITQEVIGSVHYMAPEQIHGKPRPASDQYALGIVVYEWLCGKRLFADNTFIALAMEQVNTPPPPLREEVPSLPVQIEQVVLKALAKAPEDRYPTIQAFAEAFTQATSAVKQTGKFTRSKPQFFLQTSSTQITKTTPVNYSIQAETELSDPTMDIFSQALLYMEQWRYAEAEPLLQQVLLAREKQLGPDHEDVAVCLNTLGTLFLKQRRFKEAERLLRRATSIYKRQEISTYAGMASSLNTLGSLYITQFRFKEAKQYLQQASIICEQHLGPDHLETANCLYHLGNLFLKQRQLKEADQFHRRALSIREQQLGPDHPETAHSLSRLALVSKLDQGIYHPEADYTEAEKFYLRALSIREQQLGPDHPETAHSLNGLGGVYQDMERYTEAEKFYLRALSIHEQQLGSDHLETAADLKDLGSLYKELKYYADAEHLYQKALAIYEHQLGPYDLSTGATLFSLAYLYDALDRPRSMKKYARRALAIYKRVLGRNHPSTRSAMKSYNQLLASSRRFLSIGFVRIEGD